VNIRTTVVDILSNFPLIVNALVDPMEPIGINLTTNLRAFADKLKLSQCHP
jgi:hypothetical protein